MPNNVSLLLLELALSERDDDLHFFGNEEYLFIYELVYEFDQVAARIREPSNVGPHEVFRSIRIMEKTRYERLGHDPRVPDLEASLRIN